MAGDLLMNEKTSDVILKVRHGGYSWRFPAHSLVLNFRSSVLRECLEERSSDPNPSPVTIVGLEPDTVLAIMRYLYSGIVPSKITANLLVAAEKYGLDQLRDQLEEIFLPNLTVTQACQMLEGFENEGPLKNDCTLKAICLNILEKHAFRVLASDMVLDLSRNTLLELLDSDKFNIPDEAFVFWGVWRWGFYHSSRNNRTLEEGNIASYIEDLLTRMRMCSLRNRDGIPEIALEKFNRSTARRCRYLPPDDSLAQSISLRTCGTWEDFSESPSGEEANLCLQISFDKDVMLIGLTLEACSSEKKEVYLRIFEETSRRELLRQKINCCHCISRKLSRTGEPESWIESDVVLSEPLILPRSQICSIYLYIPGTPWALPRASPRPRKRKIESTYALLHGQSVVGIRELYLVPDVTVTWGDRR